MLDIQQLMTILLYWRKKACVLGGICHAGTMKHSESGTRKVMKQLKKCPEIKEVRQLASGYMILAENGEQYLVHFSAKAFHPLRRWLKQNTSLKQLRF